MVTTLLSSKGQIVIPKTICSSHKWRSGLEFIIEEYGDSIILKPNKPFATASFEQVYGCLNYKGKRKSLREMEKAIELGARKGHDCN